MSASLSNASRWGTGRALAALVVIFLVIGTSCTSSTNSPADPRPLRNVVLGSFTADLKELAGGRVAPEFGALDSISSEPEATRDRAGIAFFAATLARHAGDPTLSALSVRVGERVLRAVPPRGDGALATAADGSADSVGSMFIAVALGSALLELGEAVPADVTVRWTARVVGAAAHLRDNGNVEFYANGNVNLGNALLYRLAHRLTGDPAWAATAQRAWRFTLDPRDARWAGFGLVITREPTQVDGSDGSGFLAERGEGGTGFDPDYTQIQTDLAARLYLVHPDPEVLRVLNLTTNAVLARVDPARWTLETSGGTRQTRPDRHVGFVSGAPAVLSLVGCRQDLRDLAVDLGRGTAQKVTTMVIKEVEQDYGLLSLGPPNMVAALGQARSECDEAPQ